VIFDVLAEVRLSVVSFGANAVRDAVDVDASLSGSGSMQGTDA